MSEEKVLAVDTNGNISYCRAKPENRGHGKCPHIVHANNGETNDHFLNRIERQESIANTKNFRHCKQLYEMERNKRYTLKLSDISNGDAFENSIYERMTTSFGQERKD